MSDNSGNFLLEHYITHHQHYNTLHTISYPRNNPYTALQRQLQLVDIIPEWNMSTSHNSGYTIINSLASHIFSTLCFGEKAGRDSTAYWLRTVLSNWKKLELRTPTVTNNFRFTTPPLWMCFNRSGRYQYRLQLVEGKLKYKWNLAAKLTINWQMDWEADHSYWTVWWCLAVCDAR